MRFAILCAAIVAALVSPSAPAHASILGVAGEFNGFIFGNLSSVSADTEGRLAVGGNFTAENYSVGFGTVGPSLPNSHGTRDDLIVGGDMNAKGGWQVFYGNAVWGTSLTAAPTTPNGSTFQGAPIDFAAVQADLLAKSAYMASLPANGTSELKWGTVLELIGTNPVLNVFNVAEFDWESSWDKQITIPTGSTALINIAGLDVDYQGGLSVNGSNALNNPAGRNVLYHFPDALTVDNNHIAMIGSLLAPKAHLTLNGGGINGVGIAASAQQVNGGEFHNFNFTGDIPFAPPAPEPASAMIFGIGAALALVASRRR